MYESKYNLSSKMKPKSTTSLLDKFILIQQSGIILYYSPKKFGNRWTIELKILE